MADLKMLTVAVDAIDAVGAEIFPEKICKLVRKHAIIAGVAAAVPVPGAAEAATIGNIWMLYKHINDELGIQLSKNKLKTIASGVAANLGASVLLMAGAAELLKFIPGFGSVSGGVIDCALAAAVTYTSAYIYLKCITAMAAKSVSGGIDENTIDVDAEIKDYMKNNKKEISSVLKEAKEEFKDIKKAKSELDDEEI